MPNVEVMDWPTIYQALMHAVERNSGIGFHNTDQGHPDYTLAANGEPAVRPADGPESNRVFQMLRELSHSDEIRSLYPGRPRIETWQDFCLLAVNAFRRDTGGELVKAE